MQKLKLVDYTKKIEDLYLIIYVTKSKKINKKFYLSLYF